MNNGAQKVVDKLDFFRDAIVLHREYKTQDLIHWLAVAADLIEDLSCAKEQLTKMESMLAIARSMEEIYKRERNALKADIFRANSKAQEMQEMLDDEVHPNCDYGLYLDLCDALGDVVDWKHKELLNNGVNEDGSN